MTWVRNFNERGAPAFAGAHFPSATESSEVENSVSPRAILAEVVHQSTLGTSTQSSVEHWITALSRTRGNLSSAYSLLSSNDQEEIRKALGNNTLQEILSLSRETDRELFSEALLNFAQRQATRRQYPLAATAYAAVNFLNPNCEIGRRAQEHLAVLQGEGPLGLRLEHFGRELSSQAMDPSLLIGMGIGIGAFETFRLATYSRLLTSPSARFFLGEFGSKAVSWGVGISAEVPAFTFAVRGIREALGHHQDWSREALWNDTKLNGITFFSLRSMGALGTAAIRRIQSSGANQTLFLRASERLIPQFSTFLGILGAHGLEIAWGLQKPTDPLNLLANSLATLVHVNVGGHLFHRVTGGRYLAGLRGLEAQWRGQRENGPPPSGQRIPTFLEILAQLAKNFSGRRFAFASEGIPNLRDPLVVWSQNNGGDSEPPQTSLPQAAPAPVAARMPELDFEHHATLKGNLGQNEVAFFHLFNRYSRSKNWAEDAYQILGQLRQSVEQLGKAITSHPEGLHLPRELVTIFAELDQISQLLHDIRGVGSNGSALAHHVPAHKIERFLRDIYRCPNILINFLDNTAPIDPALMTTQQAREALQAFYQNDPLEE